MLGYIDRRVFINTCILTTIFPSAFAPKKTAKAGATVPASNRLKKLKLIDSHFVSVDGWVIPTKTLTRGAI